MWKKYLKGYSIKDVNNIFDLGQINFSVSVSQVYLCVISSV